MDIHPFPMLYIAKYTYQKNMAGEKNESVVISLRARWGNTHHNDRQYSTAVLRRLRYIDRAQVSSAGVGPLGPELDNYVALKTRYRPLYGAMPLASRYRPLYPNLAHV